MTRTRLWLVVCAGCGSLTVADLIPSEPPRPPLETNLGRAWLDGAPNPDEPLVLPYADYFQLSPRAGLLFMTWAEVPCEERLARRKGSRPTTGPQPPFATLAVVPSGPVPASFDVDLPVERFDRDRRGTSSRLGRIIEDGIAHPIATGAAVGRARLQRAGPRDPIRYEIDLTFPDLVGDDGEPAWARLHGVAPPCEAEWRMLDAMWSNGCWNPKNPACDFRPSDQFERFSVTPVVK